MSIDAAHHPCCSASNVRARTVDLLTTVMESAYYGRSTSSSAGGGIVLVKTQRVLVLATYTDPVMAAEAIPYVHEFTDSVMGTLGGM